MQVSMYKSFTLTSGKYVKSFSNNTLILNLKNSVKYYALRSLLASPYPGKTNQKNNINYRDYFAKYCIECIGFSEGLKNEKIHKLERKNNLNHKVLKLKIVGSSGTTYFLPFYNSQSFIRITGETINQKLFNGTTISIFMRRKWNFVPGNSHQTYVCRHSFISFQKENTFMKHQIPRYLNEPWIMNVALNSTKK